MYIHEGFPGQRLRVMPAPLARAALKRPATSQILVTDCGYFPRAMDHGRSRPLGSAQLIVILCAEGAGWCELPTGSHIVRSGQALVIPPGTPHSYGADPSDPWSIWWLHIAGSDVHELFTAMRVNEERPVIGIRDPYRTSALIDEALTRMETDESTSSLVAAAGAAWHLLALLAADQTNPSQREDPVRQCVIYLQDRIGLRTSVGELAALAGLSPSHFAALFTRATGHGVLEYQTSLRMSRARELLDQTSESVAAVSRAVGYTDALYFSRQFRKHHGVSPSEYRAHAKG